MNNSVMENLHLKTGERDSLAHDVENFLANGGKISYHAPEDSRFNLDLEKEKASGELQARWERRVSTFSKRNKHHKLKALEMTGNPNARVCGYCKQYDDPANMRKYTRTKGGNTSSSYVHVQRNKTCVNLDYSPRIKQEEAE